MSQLSAVVVELVDTSGLGPDSREAVGVQIPPTAPFNGLHTNKPPHPSIPTPSLSCKRILTLLKDRIPALA